jgi:hypothetical protein
MFEPSNGESKIAFYCEDKARTTGDLETVGPAIADRAFSYVATLRKSEAHS